MKNAVIATLVVALAVSIAAGVIARASRTVNVEVRVWQDVDEPDALWLSARADGGSWADLGTIPVPLDDGSGGAGRYRYGDVTLALSVPPPPSCQEAALAFDCALLLAARDALAGDGALNWSADVPVTEWDGVTVSGTPQRVTGLDLRDRGLTGTIPPHWGSLPPTLARLHLAGNALTGCVPERLRLAENDLEQLMAERELGYCPVPEVPWSEDALSPGTYRLGRIIVDIPASDLKVVLCGSIHVDFATPEDEPEGRSHNASCFGDLDGRWEMWLDAYYAVEWGRSSTDADADDQTLPADVDALFDQIAATARTMPPPSCWEAALAVDCAILLAARDTLAGDGALNWSVDVPVKEWAGVAISGTPRRVTGLYLRSYGLTGAIPPELGNLPPTLATVHLAGNALTGCVPERLRLVRWNDLGRLMAERDLSWCPVAALPFTEDALAPGTYQVQGNIIVDIPVASVQAKLSSLYASDGGPGSGHAYCFSDLAERWEVCLDSSSGEEILRAIPPSINPSGASGISAEVDALLDQIAATARPAPPPPPSCAEPSLAPDCAILLAARDALAGDGALNWSADVPVTEWDGVTVSDWERVTVSHSSRRVWSLDLRNRGLTGIIPPELGRLPPTLVHLLLAGNALTGCVPERLRLARRNDLEQLMAERELGYCPVPEVTWSLDALSPGTYRLDRIIVDIPASDLKVVLCGSIHLEITTPDDIPQGQSQEAICFGDLDGRWEMWLDAHYAVEWGRSSTDSDADNQALPADVDALFDQIATMARTMPPPSCWEAALASDCAILLAARDTLAGDGALNWSVDVPVEEWDGVTVSGTPRRVTGLDLRDRGLTGSIPPNLGHLPPTLARLHLAGNALTGCVPERLRLAENDLEVLMMERELRYCPLPEVLWNDEAIPPGTYQLGDSLVVDIPANDFEVTFCGIVAVERFPVPGQSYDGVCFGDLDGRWAMWLDRYYAVEWWRYSTDADGGEDEDDQPLPADVDALFDRIAAAARPAPPSPCWDDLACAVLWTARDALAGDGALNWSADIPMWMWDGVSLSVSRQVTRLDLRNRGLTGTIPPELGNLALEELGLSGNAFTGCVPERLRLVRWNDLGRLMMERGLSWCPVAVMPSATILSAGTYQIDGPEGIGLEVLRWIDSDATEEMSMAVNTLFDRIAATARPAPP